MPEGSSRDKLKRKTVLDGDPKKMMELRLDEACPGDGRLGLFTHTGTKGVVSQCDGSTRQTRSKILVKTRLAMDSLQQQQQQQQHPWMTMDVDTMGTALTVLRLLMTTQAAEGRCAAADVMEQSGHKMMPMPHVLLTHPGCVPPLPAALYHKAGGKEKKHPKWTGSEDLEIVMMTLSLVSGRRLS
jgi:hypothetical protein